MLALSDALSEWGVDNTALQLNTAEQLRELPMPFVAHLNGQGGRYVLVTALKGDRLTYTNTERNSKTESLAAFEKQWSGALLLAEANEQAGESDYATKRTHERLQQVRGPVVLAGIGLLAALALWGAAPHLTLIDYGWLLTKATGLFVSVLLVSKVMDHANALADQLCRLTSQTDCNSILNAPAAKLWGWLSWADVGLLYFAGGLLAALAVGYVPALRPVLGTLALLALPYVAFSLYYQGLVMRQWCTLCLLVQAVLLAEGILTVTNYTELPTVWQPYAVVVALLLLPALIWMVLKPLLSKYKEGQQHYERLAKLRRDPDLFRALVQQQKQTPDWLPERVIILGNPDAEHTITLVTDPYCGPCASTHEVIEDLLARINLQVNLVVLACDGSTSRATQVLRHWLALQHEGRVATALRDWYTQPIKDYAAWAKRWPIAVETVSPEATEQYCTWCRQAGIVATPTVFVDGYMLPGLYNLAELRPLLNSSMRVTAPVS